MIVDILLLILLSGFVQPALSLVLFVLSLFGLAPAQVVL